MLFTQITFLVFCLFTYYHRHSGKIISVILAESVAAKKKQKQNYVTNIQQCCPTAKYQMSHYVIIENSIIKQDHMKKTMLPKKNLKKLKQKIKLVWKKFFNLIPFNFPTRPELRVWVQSVARGPLYQTQV